MTLAASARERSWRRRIRILGLVAATVAALVLCLSGNFANTTSLSWKGSATVTAT